MSWKQFEEDCSGCRPVLIDTQTGQVSAPDSPEQKIIDDLWGATTKPERVAWHAVTCLNSRAPEHLTLMQGFAQRIQEGLKK
jgi:hypothetical protein